MAIGCLINFALLISNCEIFSTFYESMLNGDGFIKKNDRVLGTHFKKCKNLLRSLFY